MSFFPYPDAGRALRQVARHVPAPPAGPLVPEVRLAAAAVTGADSPPGWPLTRQLPAAARRRMEDV